MELGKKLFFDPRLSGDGNMSCATCHNPLLGWSDGLATGKGVKSMVLDRASPTVVNTAYNSIQMWDGRKKSLEDQAMGPMEATVEMNMDTQKLFNWLNGNEGYRALFHKAYPGKPIDADSVSKAIASFERTVISNSSPFDQWVAGKKDALTADEVQRFRACSSTPRRATARLPLGPELHRQQLPQPGSGVVRQGQPRHGPLCQTPGGQPEGRVQDPDGARGRAARRPTSTTARRRTLEELVDFYAKGGMRQDEPVARA